MKRILTATAMTLLATSAFAGGPGEILKEHQKPSAITKAGECTAPFPLSLLDERSDGSNCPATATEKRAGELLVFTVISGAILQGAGVVDIPAELGALQAF